MSERGRARAYADTYAESQRKGEGASRGRSRIGRISLNAKT